jgi:ABC-type amino acid transport substrate-binding protein
VGGFAALFCDWLTDLFEIEFQPVILSTNILVEQLNNKELDFSGNIMPTREREAIYSMTDIISERQFILIQPAGTPSVNEIKTERPVRYAVVANTPMEAAVVAVSEPGTYEIVLVTNYMQAYQLMLEDKADAFIAANIN